MIAPPGLLSPELKKRLITLDEARQTKTAIFARSPASKIIDGKQVNLYFKVKADSPGARLPSMVIDELKRDGILEF